MFWTFFRIVGKALRFGIARPMQRFNIESRSKKHLGEDAKYFKPAPRAIGPMSQFGPSQYPHLEGGGFKSIKQKRLEAIQDRNQRLLQADESTPKIEAAAGHKSFRDRVSAIAKSFSETRRDDKLIIESLPKLPVIKTIIHLDQKLLDSTKNIDNNDKVEETKQIDTVKKPARPLPKSTNLDLRDPTQIWHTEKVPPGRINLNQFQELMLNKLTDEKFWTPDKISETYNIKSEYAELLTTYLKQVRVVLSPRMAKVLDYTARTDPVYQTTKDVIYFVDKSLRTEFDKKYDDMYLPTDEIDPEIRELISQAPVQQIVDERATLCHFKHVPLRLEPGKTRPDIIGPINQPSLVAPSQMNKEIPKLEEQSPKPSSPTSISPPSTIPSQENTPSKT